MAFSKKNKTYLDKEVPVGEKGKKYVDELKNIRDDLENLKKLTEQVKSSKGVSLETMDELNKSIKKLREDTQQLNKDFPDLGFKID